MDQLPVPESVKQNLYGMGLTKLFEIQSRAFEPIFRGRSFVGRSRTGTGKTIAYLLPLLERMRHEKISAPHSLLILVPTIELCKQVGSTVLSLSVSTDVALVYGGPSLESQEQLVRMGAKVVIATPGRCARLVERGALQTKNVRALVIDEADAMLGLEYIGRVERVLAAVAKGGLQLVLFSASMSPEVHAVVNRHLTHFEFVDLVDRGGIKGQAAVQTVSHHLCKVSNSRAARARVLLHFLNSRLDLQLSGRCIIFVDSTSEARSLLSHPALDARARALHSESTPQERDEVITAFANREFDVLITSDIVSRGVDFQDVSLVLQMHPPRDAAQYVHRAGRTGRAGQGGACITLYDHSEHNRIQRVRTLTKQNFRMESTPSPYDIHHASVSRLIEQLLSVQPEEFDPLVADATKLLEEQGPQVLATAMAVLDSRHSDFERATRETPSLLSGRKGFTCLLIHDPEHSSAGSEGELRRIVGRLLSEKASDDAFGQTCRVKGGWAIDLDQRFATVLLEDLRTGRRSAPFELTLAKRLPAFLRRSPRRSKAPWASMRKRAMSRRAVETGGAKGGPREDGRWPGSSGARKRR